MMAVENNPIMPIIARIIVDSVIIELTQKVIEIRAFTKA